MGHFDDFAKVAADRIQRLSHVFVPSRPFFPAPPSANREMAASWRDAEARRAREFHFHLIVESIPSPVAIMSPAGELEAVNRLTLDYFGKTFDELKNWGNGDAVHPDDLPRAAAVWTEAIATGRNYEVESRHRRADGVYRWFQVHGFPLRDADGRIAHWCVLQTDIEDRKQAEAALKQSEERKAAILDAALDCIVTINHEGCITEFNPAAERTFGHRRDDVIGKRLADMIIPPSLRERHQVGLDRYIATGESRVIGTRVEMTAMRADGTEFPVELAITRLSQDGLPSFTGYLRDITERKQAEEKLRRSEAFLAEAQQLSSTGSFSWRVETDEIAWSEQLYRIFEYEPGARVTFELIAARVHPEDMPILFEMIDRGRSAVNDLEYEHRLLMPDQSVKYLHLIACGVRDKDGRLEYIGAAQDVTQRRLSDEALAKVRSELSHVARVTSLGVLTASIAHEVNQPLGSIIINGETALRWLARPDIDVEKVKELTKRVVADARRAADIIERIRAMATRRAPQRTPLSIDDIVEESLVFLRHEFQSKGISVSLELAPALPKVVGDRTQIQQVIVNLAMNAVQAMTTSEGTRRSLIVRAVQPDPATVCCMIEDSGPGIDPEHIPHLFDSFFTTKDTGMGMGLPISRSIIEAHNGHIRADNDSAIGGARFSFALPADG
jgi:hypothetical protein